MLRREVKWKGLLSVVCHVVMVEEAAEKEA